MARRRKTKRRSENSQPPSTPGKRRSERAQSSRGNAMIFVLIFLVALCFRLVYVANIQQSPLYDSPSMDEQYHDEWAQAIAAGEIFVKGPYFRAPLYPAFLGAVYSVFGHNYTAPRIIQCVLGSISCGLLFLIGLRVFGRWVGAVAGFAAAGYWMLIYFDGELLIPSVIILFDLVLILLLLRSLSKPSLWTVFACGIVLGLSAIARPNVLLFLPALIGWFVLRFRPSPSRTISHSMCLSIGCLMVVLPITIRNYVVGQDVVLISSQAGVNFYIGNNALSNGRTAIVPGTPGGWWEGYHASIRRAEEAEGRTLEPSEVSRYYFREAFSFIGQEPLRFTSLLWLKTRLFWTRWELPNNKDIYFWIDRHAPWLHFLPLGFGLVAPLGLAGIGICVRRRLELFPLWGFVAVYTVSVILFFCTARYRMPVVAPLILFAVHAVFEGVRSFQLRQWKQLGGGLLLVGLGAVLVNVPPQGLAVRNDALAYVGLGSAYSRKNLPKQAEAEFRRAIELQPDYVTARFNLGEILRQSNRMDEAIQHFRRAIESRHRLSGETDATMALVHFSLASAYEATGSYIEAAKHFRLAGNMDSNCYPGRVQFNLALVLTKSGAVDEARDAFAEAIHPLRSQLEAVPDDSQLLYALGRSLFALGDQADAAVALRRVLDVQPDHLPALNYLSNGLTQEGRYAEAIALLRPVLRLDKRWITTRLTLLLAASPDDRIRRGAEALQLGRQLCPRTDDCSPRELDALAAALAEVGRFEEAIDAVQVATNKTRASARNGGSRFVQMLEKHAQLYRGHQVYRLSPRPAAPATEP